MKVSSKALLLLVSSVIASQIMAEDKVYIVGMAEDPLIAYSGDLDGFPATKPGKGEKIDPNSADCKKYGAHLKESHLSMLNSVGVSTDSKIHDYMYVLNGFAAMLTEVQVTALSKDPHVVSVIPDELRNRTTDSSPTFLGLDSPGGPWSRQYEGEDVIVGVIDDGIWPEHPSFEDDGTYSSLGLDIPCEFGNWAHNPADLPFACNNKLLGARQMLTTYRTIIGADPDEFDSARDDNGHGTHTASTAAGNRDVKASVQGAERGHISGVAPRARIIAYKGLGNLGGFGSDLAAAIEQAVVDGVDVINYSIGSIFPALIGPDDLAFLGAADAGVFVATSAGNSGPGPATIGSPASVPWLTSVGASTQSRALQGSAKSSDGWEFFGASIAPVSTAEVELVDAEDAGGEFCFPGSLNSSIVEGKIVLCRRGAVARDAKSFAVLQAGGIGMILYNNDDAQSELTDTHSVPSVHINNSDGLVIKQYIQTDPDPVASITMGVAVDVDAPWMAAFSSRGPNAIAEDIIKPDITAPGVQILAGYSPFPDPGEVPGQLFGSLSGTSMSSPHVAGVFALIKQAHPDWTPAMAKSAIMTSAYQDVMKEDGQTQADPFDFGAGHLNPGDRANNGSGVDRMKQRSGGKADQTGKAGKAGKAGKTGKAKRGTAGKGNSNGKPKKLSAFEPGLAYDVGFLEYLGFLCDAEPAAFANPSETCASLESLGIPTIASDLNLPSIGVAKLPGSKVVQRTVTSVATEKGWRTYKAKVDSPPGIHVVVEPSTLHLKSGDSATYSIIFTAGSTANIDEWSFGSLTWSDKHGLCDVYSPIAVRPSLFAAADELVASGVIGSLSFDVSFGYTGSYLAQAHGLEPATVTIDSVVQDPDQSFDPGDGFSTVHSFSVSGAALFRVAIPPDAVANENIDLDVYVEDPNGFIVGASGQGGTNELVDILLPEDGTWKVYVHGWDTGGSPADYVLYTWVISLTPGGNLAIDDAPNAAVIGTSGDVDVSWSGATAGAWHLGAVSHTGDSGLLGLTLIDVDNRVV